jgi:hypothetical protein
METVFHGVVGFSVFTTVSKYDAPITKLREEPAKSRFPWLTRRTYEALILLPAFTVFYVIVMDVLTICVFNAPFREGNEPLMYTLTRPEWAKRAVMETICILLLIPTVTLCLRTIWYNDGTQSVLKEYEEVFEKKDTIVEDESAKPKVVR